LIAKHRPTAMLELGDYIGCSAILFGNAIKQVGEERYYSIEKDPLFAAVSISLLNLAGLRDVVKVVVGIGAERVQLLVDKGVLCHADTKLGMLLHMVTGFRLLLVYIPL
jgi:catechol O-methyltransferase